MSARLLRPLALLLAGSLLLAGCPAQSDVPIVTAGNSPGDSSTNVAGGAASTASQPTAQCREPADGSSLRAQVLTRVNAERLSRGLVPLTTNLVLQAQADAYACELITYDFFAHENPVTGSTLRDRTEQFHYEYQTVGENLAAGQPTPDEVMTAWMNSPGHAANILRPEFTEIGIGIRLGGDYGIYWVQEFGQPREPAGP